MSENETNYNCQICSSALANDILEKRKLGAKRLVRWAGARGLQINDEQLLEHFARHIQNGANGNGTKTDGEIVTLISAPPDKKAESCQSADNTNQPPNDTPPQKQPTTTIGDEQFLNQIIEQVHSHINSGELELKVEHAFKAIELKQKLIESGGVESLLLELLSEIREQELA